MIDILQALQCFMPFTEIETENLRKIADSFHEKVFNPGELLVTEGEPADGIAIIISGRAAAFTSHQDGELEWFCDLLESDFYGDIELLNGRGSWVMTIVCRQCMECLFLPAEDFFRSIDAYPGIKAFLSQIALQKISLILDRYRLNNELRAAIDKGAPGGERPFECPPCVHRAVAYIDIHFASPISLDIVARESGVSKYHLSRFFKNRTGKNFKQYLNHKRIIEAKKLMRNRDMNVTETCYAVGFNDLSYFSKLFQQFEKTTPSKYRRMTTDLRAREIAAAI